MSDKHLPIQFFEKRKDYDDRSTEGGGNTDPPSWVLTGEVLKTRSAQLSGGIQYVSEQFHKKIERGDKLPLVVCTAIEEKAIAKSHRRDVTSLFADGKRSNILGFWENRYLLSMVVNEAVLHTMTKTISNTRENAKLISSITDISPFYPMVDAYDENTEFYKVRLINYNNYDLDYAAKIIFEQQCTEKGITIAHKVKFTSDMTIYRICLDSMEQLSLLEDFESIYSVEKMMPIEATIDGFLQPMTIPPKVPKEDVTYPIVGVLDTGISDNDFLNPWKLENSFTSYPDEYRNPAHGTFVSGIIAYGDELNTSKYTSLPAVKLFDATVYPDESKEHIYIDDLIEHIREAIERNRTIKIWNLSLGTDNEAELDKFSDFGMALDNIQDENDVLIVKSAGNCRNFMCQRPKSRIAKSADSVRALVVGSLAETQGDHDYAVPNSPSPFTRIGPGPSSIIKPDLVFYGGNAGMFNGKLYTSGVTSLTPDGQLCTNVGTSFSTPWVTRMAAELSFLMEQEFDPLLIKALLIHNAKYPSGCDMNMVDKVTQMGFGMPVSVKEMLYNSSDEITLILRDTLEKGSFIEMFDFPFPSSLVDENGFFFGQIIVTLVTKSLVDDKQAGEYCQSNIDVLFGTYETEKERDTKKRTIKNSKGVGGAQNILFDNCYSTRAKGVYPHTGFERECTLVKYGKKFHPVKKYAIDLSDMTPSNKERYLCKNRKWYLKIEGLYRDFIENDAQEQNYQLSQEYCMILTIRDPNGKAPVYDEVSQQLDYRNFIHHNITLRNVIEIDESEK